MSNDLIKVIFVGVGNIGKDLYEMIDSDSRFIDYRISGATNNNIPSKSAADSVYREQEDLLQLDYDVLIEALPPAPVPSYVIPAIKAGKTVLLCTVGILSSCPEILHTLAQSDGRIIVPYGAIMTIPNIKSLKENKITQAHHRVTKSPESLGIDPESITKPTVIFDNGTAEEAIKKFGKNVNTSITLSLLCGLPFNEMRVTITADPAAQGNKHHVEASGPDFTFNETYENKKSANAGTSVGTSESAAMALLSPEDAAFTLYKEQARGLIILNGWKPPTPPSYDIGAP